MKDLKKFLWVFFYSALLLSYSDLAKSHDYNIIKVSQNFEENASDPCAHRGQIVGRKSGVLGCKCGDEIYGINNNSNPCWRSYEIALEERPIEEGLEEKECKTDTLSPSDNSMEMLTETIKKIDLKLLVIKPNLSIAEREKAKHGNTIDKEVKKSVKTSIEKKLVKKTTPKLPKSKFKQRTLKDISFKKDGLPSGAILPMPELKAAQINEIFTTDSKLMFDLTYDPGILKKLNGSGDSRLFHDLSKHKLFALAFADLYLLERAKIEEEAIKILDKGESFTIKMYFKRFRSDLASFGSKEFQVTEKDCINWLKAGAIVNVENSEFNKFCAPAVNLELHLTENGKTSKKIVIYSKSQLPYGPGTGRALLNSQAIIESMKKLKP